jgi:hypothetical protein
VNKDQLERRIDELFAEEPSTFVARRNALVHELAADKQADAKTRVHDLRRPTVAAWIVNLLHRTKRTEFDSLIAAGAELRSAQQALLDGNGSKAFAAATERERKATTRLLDEAHTLLESHGRSPAVELRQVGATLRALARDPQASAAFDGRLSEALEPPGFDSLQEAAASAASVPGIGKGEHDSKQIERRSESSLGQLRDIAKDGHQERLRQELERREQQRLDREAQKRQALEDDRADARALLEERCRQAERLQWEADSAEKSASTATERVQEVERLLRETRGEEQRAVASTKRAKLAAEAAVAEVRHAQERFDQLDRQLNQSGTYSHNGRATKNA